MTRQEAIKHLEEWKECISSAYRRQVIDVAIEALADRPTGEWEQVDLLADRLCSVCGYGVWDSEAEEYNFCPNCGAKMRGGEDE